MRDTRYPLMLVLSLIALMVACGDDTTTTTPTTPTDTGASSSSGADGASSSSGGDAAASSSSGGDAAASSSGGGTCTPKFVTPTMDWGKGCTDAADATFLGGLAKDDKEAAKFGGVVKDCTLPCLGKAEAEAIKCIADCIVKDSKLGADCATCYGVDAFCAGKHCLSFCVAAPTGKECADCRACNCAPAASVCQAGTKK